MMEHYVLDDQHRAIAIDTSTLEGLLAWGKWFQHADRCVARTVLRGGVLVSTVFLALDHSWGGSKPVLFETMIFGGRADQDQHRYCTWEEAERAHKAIVARLRYFEGSCGYSQSHWRKIRRSVLMAEETNVIPFPKRAAA